MPFINLIEEQRLSVRANERKAQSFFTAFIAVCVLSVGGYGYLTLQAAGVAGDAGEVQLQNQKNAPLVKQIDENARALADLSPRLKTLEDASIITDRWNRILEHLTVQMPDQAFLSNLRCEAADPQKPIQVSFMGLAPSQSPVGEFILRLQNQPDLENVSLRYTNEKLVSESRSIEFQVDSNLVGTAEKPKVAEASADGEKK